MTSLRQGSVNSEVFQSIHNCSTLCPHKLEGNRIEELIILEEHAVNIGLDDNDSDSTIYKNVSDADSATLRRNELKKIRNGKRQERRETRIERKKRRDERAGSRKERDELEQERREKLREEFEADVKKHWSEHPDLFKKKSMTKTNDSEEIQVDRKAKIIAIIGLLIVLVVTGLLYADRTLNPQESCDEMGI
ncbi:uncharacterized protein LOC144432072 [Styela clava]